MEPVDAWRPEANRYESGRKRSAPLVNTGHKQKRVALSQSAPASDRKWPTVPRRSHEKALLDVLRPVIVVVSESKNVLRIKLLPAWQQLSPRQLPILAFKPVKASDCEISSFRCRPQIGNFCKSGWPSFVKQFTLPFFFFFDRLFTCSQCRRAVYFRCSKCQIF